MIKRLLRYYKDNEDIYEHYLQLFFQNEVQNEDKVYKGSFKTAMIK